MILPKSGSSLTAYFALAISILFLFTYHYGTTYILVSGVLAAALVVFRAQYLEYKNDHVWLMFVGYFTYGMFFTSLMGQALNAIYYYMLPLVCYVLGSLAPVYRRKYEYLIVVIVMIVMTVLTFLMYFQLSGGGFDLSVAFMMARSRAESYILHNEEILIGATVIAPMISLIVLSSAFIFASRRGVFTKVLGLLFGSYAAGLQVLAGSRTGVLSVFIIILVVFWSTSTERSIRQYLGNSLGSIAIAVVLVTILLVSMSSSSDAYYRFSTLFQLQVDSSMAKRFELWERALEFFASGLLGNGPSFFFDKMGLSTHNELLGVLVSLGLPGIILWLAAHGALLRRLILSRQMYGKSLGYYAGILVIIFFTSLTESYSYSGAFFSAPVLFFCLGMATNNNVRR